MGVGVGVGVNPYLPLLNTFLAIDFKIQHKAIFKKRVEKIHFLRYHTSKHNMSEVAFDT